LFVTNPAVRIDHTDEAAHPLRVIARPLLKGEGLTLAHRVLLQGWVETASPVHHGIPMSSPARSLDDVIRDLHVSFWIERDPAVEGLQEHAGRPVVTFIWLVPWAVMALSEAQFYELDCSFEALRPSPSSIPMSVKANPGIPLGIAVTPTERQHILRLLANNLIEQGFPRDHLARLPLRSDEGTALNAHAIQYHELHFYCDRYLLEALSSGTFAPMLARRRLCPYTQQEFRDVVDQTMCDFKAAEKKHRP
jgi:hypothetical protein